jgi:hypothetical protein
MKFLTSLLLEELDYFPLYDRCEDKKFTFIDRLSRKSAPHPRLLLYVRNSRAGHCPKAFAPEL